MCNPVFFGIEKTDQSVCVVGIKRMRSEAVIRVESSGRRPEHSQGRFQVSSKKVFLYGELQMTVPFGEVDWRSINAELKKVPGLVRKTWLYGMRGGSVGGFYEFDSEDNARRFAVGPYAQEAANFGASLTVKLFDGEITEAASRDMDSPHCD